MNLETLARKTEDNLREFVRKNKAGKVAILAAAWREGCRREKAGMFSI